MPPPQIGMKSSAELLLCLDLQRAKRSGQFWYSARRLTGWSPIWSGSPLWRPHCSGKADSGKCDVTTRGMELKYQTQSPCQTQGSPQPQGPSQTSCPLIPMLLLRLRVLLRPRVPRRPTVLPRPWVLLRLWVLLRPRVLGKPVVLPRPWSFSDLGSSKTLVLIRPRVLFRPMGLSPYCSACVAPNNPKQTQRGEVTNMTSTESRSEPSLRNTPGAPQTSPTRKTI